MRTRTTFKPNPNSFISKLRTHIDGLGTRRFTTAQIAKAMGLQVATARYYLWMLHKKKLIHVASWKKPGPSGGARQPIYKAGEGEDAKRPPPDLDRQRETRRLRMLMKREAAKKSKEQASIRRIPVSVFDLAQHH